MKHNSFISVRETRERSVDTALAGAQQPLQAGFKLPTDHLLQLQVPLGPMQSMWPLRN